MIPRMLLVAAAASASAGVAWAQPVLDLSDPVAMESLTRKPTLDMANMRTPDYPAPARSKQQQGEVIITACIDVSGKVTSARIEKPSGFDMLDDASIKWMNSGARFLPAEAKGGPVAVCNYKFTYVWSLPSYPPSVAPVNDTSAYLGVGELKPTERPFIRMQPKRPVYPPGALERKSEGVLHMSLCITPEGRLASILLHDGDFDAELRSATSMWYGMSTFEPGKQDGKPVGVCDFDVAYEWKLPN